MIGEHGAMPELVVSDRAVARILAVVPAVVVVVCVRVLTLGTPPAAARVAAAGAVALACWTAYRLLTVKVTVGATGVHVRGVFYDADLGYDALQTAAVGEPTWPVRLLVWGLMRPNGVELRTSKGTVRPLALVSVDDDDEVERAVMAIRVRTGAWRMPTQREASASQVTTG